MNSVSVNLEIHDVHGVNAKLTKRYQIVPNFAYLHRNIASDGSISNLCWNGRPIPASDIKAVLGENQVTINFKAPSAKGVAFAGALSYDLSNSFPATDEALVYVVDFPSPMVTLQIDLPTG